jgi:hypothetical protein
MKPSLDIVVVNWNSGDHLRECIRAIADTDRSGIDVQRVVVVDNDSEDGSDLDLDLDVPGITLELVRNHRNLGFATACNQGAQGGRSDYVLFLNPDVSVASNALKAPIEWMERAEQSTVGICGIRLLDGEGALQPSCSRFPSTMTTLATILGLDRMPRRPFRGDVDAGVASRRDTGCGPGDGRVLPRPPPGVRAPGRFSTSAISCITRKSTSPDGHSLPGGGPRSTPAPPQPTSAAPVPGGYSTVGSSIRSGAAPSTLDGTWAAPRRPPCCSRACSSNRLPGPPWPRGADQAGI